MSEWLGKDKALFERDEKGELLPVEVELTLLRKKDFIKEKQADGTETEKEIIKEYGPKVEVIPVPRGKWRRIIKEEDEKQDLILLTEHVHRPKFTEEDYKEMKPLHMAAIVQAITAVTLDVTQEEAKADIKELTAAEEVALEKKSELQEEEQPSSCTNTATTSSTWVK